MALTELEQNRLETATRVIHETTHLISRGHACDRCRARARAVARVLWGTSDLENPVRPAEDARLPEVIDRYWQMSPADRESFVQLARSLTNRPSEAP